MSEPEIKAALHWAHNRGWMVEGAAAMTIAAYFQEAPQSAGKTIVIVSCGGNLAPEVLQQIQESGQRASTTPGTDLP